MKRILDLGMMFSVILAAAIVTSLANNVASLWAGEMPPAVGDKAKDFELTSIGGEQVKLSRMTEVGPVVLVVLRGYPGYQCPLCTKQAGDFISKSDAFKASGAHVLFVYPGPNDKLKERAAEFVKGKDYPDHFHLLLDPDYKFVNSYGLRWEAEGETAYPSTFVINSQRAVTFSTISKSHGGRSKADEALKSVKAQP